MQIFHKCQQNLLKMNASQRVDDIQVQARIHQLRDKMGQSAAALTKGRRLARKSMRQNSGSGPKWRLRYAGFDVSVNTLFRFQRTNKLEDKIQLK